MTTPEFSDPAPAAGACLPPCGVARGSGHQVRIADLSVDDQVLAELLDAQPAEAWPGLVRRALTVGAAGLVDMGVGVGLRALDERVRATLDAVATEAHTRARDTLDEAGRALTAQFDPEMRSSLVARAIAEFGATHDRLLGELDPSLSTSHTARFIAAVTELLGPGGRLAETLTAALDPDADGSALARLGASVDARFQELRDLIMHESGRAAEAERGTAKGGEFEETVELRLRELARGLGAVVERVGREPGALGADSVVGDFVVTFQGGARLVVEAKNVAKLSLAGRNGILGELDRAAANRQADFAICVSAQDAYPAEVGHFGVYGSRALVVDGGDGVLLGVAVRWARAVLAAAPASAAELDPGFILERLARLKKLAQRFVTGRRTLSDVRSSVERVRDDLDAMRCDLLELVDDIGREVAPTSQSSDAVARVA